MFDGRNMLRLLSSLVASRMGLHLLLLLILLLLALSVVADPPNKYRQREATDDVLPYPNLDEEDIANTQCPQHIELRWQAEVSSSIYATPLIADINGDGKLDIVVPSFVHNLEVLDGSDGEKLPGWPVSHQSTAHSSPLMYDIDKDGVREIALATYNGEVLFFRPSGFMMMEKLVVPRTQEKKAWYAGLKQDHADRAHPDVNDESLIPKNLSQASTTEQNKSPLSADDANGKPSSNTNADSNTLKSSVSVMNNLQKINNETDGSIAGKLVNSANFNIPSNIVTTNQNKSNSVGEKGNITLASPGNLDARIDADTGLEVVGNNLQMATASVNLSNSGANSELHRRLLEDAVSKDKGKSMEEQPAVENIPTAKNEQALEDEADASFEVFRDEKEKIAEDGITEEYQYDYDDYY